MRHKTVFLLFLVLGFGLSIVSTQAQTTIKKISSGILNGKATSLPKPEFPAAARAVGASGAVNVQVTIDEQGNVVSATAVSGHPLLRQAAEKAALEAKFNPTILSGQPVSVSGILVYNFVGTPNWSSEGLALGIAENKGIRGQMVLPEGFSDEQLQLNAIAKFPAAEQQSQISAVISLIKSKLNAADLWRFEFGLAKGGILSYNENGADISTHLAKFKELASNKPQGVQDYEFNRAVELSKFGDKAILTAENKQMIFEYLK